MDALALVVCIVIFVSATVMFFCGALIVVLRVRRHRWAATRWALQQARRESEAIPPPSYIRAAGLPMLVGVAIGGVIVLSTYLYVAYQSRPALVLGLGIFLLVAGWLRRVWAALALTMRARIVPACEPGLFAVRCVTVARSPPSERPGAVEE